MTWIAGAMSLPDPAKDDNEAQVAAFVKRIGGYVERLKEAAAQARGQKGGGANEHTVAHMHGVVGGGWSGHQYGVKLRVWSWAWAGWG